MQFDSGSFNRFAHTHAEATTASATTTSNGHRMPLEAFMPLS